MDIFEALYIVSKALFKFEEAVEDNGIKTNVDFDELFKAKDIIQQYIAGKEGVI